MGVDHGDGRQEVDRINRRVKILETASPSYHTTDSLHPGSGNASVQIGPDADAAGGQAIAIGYDSRAHDDYAIAISGTAYYDCVALRGLAGSDITASAIAILGIADQDYSIAIGSAAQAHHEASVALGRNAVTTDDYQIMLGSSNHTVAVLGDLIVDGTFSNPSSRTLKKNIIPAPVLSDLFPDLVEYEYIDRAGKRRLGYIAEDLTGDAARFVTVDDDGNPNGIDYIGLLVAQVAVMHAELVELRALVEDNSRGEEHG